MRASEADPFRVSPSRESSSHNCATVAIKLERQATESSYCTDRSAEIVGHATHCR